MGAQPSIPGMEESFAKDFAEETDKEIRPFVTFENFPGVPNGQVVYNKYDNSTQTLFYEGNSHKIKGLTSLDAEFAPAEFHMLLRELAGYRTQSNLGNPDVPEPLADDWGCWCRGTCWRIRLETVAQIREAPPTCLV